MSLDPNKAIERDVAIRHLRSLRKAYNVEARNPGRKQWYEMCVAALECALLALGDKPENWDTK